MERIDLEKISKNIEIYKYMLWDNTNLNPDESNISINYNIDENKADFFEYNVLVNLTAWCDADIKELTSILEKTTTSIENFISEYQLNHKGKIIRDSSKNFSFLGPFLYNLNFNMEDDKLTSVFEYTIETIEN